MRKVINKFLKSKYMLEPDDCSLEVMMRNPERYETLFSCFHQLNAAAASKYYQFIKNGTLKDKVKILGDYAYWCTPLQNGNYLSGSGFIEYIPDGTVWFISELYSDASMKLLMDMCHGDKLPVALPKLCIAFLLARHTCTIRDLFEFSYWLVEGKVYIKRLQPGKEETVEPNTWMYDYAMQLLTEQALKKKHSFSIDRFDKVLDTFLMKSRSVLQRPGVGILKCVSGEVTVSLFTPDIDENYLIFENKNVTGTLYRTANTCFMVGCHQPEMEHMISKLNNVDNFESDVEELSHKLDASADDVRVFLDSLTESKRTELYKKICVPN